MNEQQFNEWQCFPPVFLAAYEPDAEAYIATMRCGHEIHFDRWEYATSIDTTWIRLIKPDWCEDHTTVKRAEIIMIRRDIEALRLRKKAERMHATIENE